MKKAIAGLLSIIFCITLAPSAFASQGKINIDESELYGEWNLSYPDIDFIHVVSDYISTYYYISSLVLCEGGIGIITIGENSELGIYMDKTYHTGDKVMARWYFKDGYVHIETVFWGLTYCFSLKVEEMDEDVILTDCLFRGLIEAKSQLLYRGLLAAYESDKAGFGEAFESAFKSGDEQDQADFAMIDYILNYSGNITSFDDLVGRYDIKELFSLNNNNLDDLALEYLIIHQSEDIEKSMAYFDFPKMYYEKGQNDIDWS